MKRWLIIVLCLACSSAFAQQPADAATKEDVQKLMDVMHTRKQFDQLMGIFKQEIPALMESVRAAQLPDATPEQVAKLREFTDRTFSKVLDKLPYDELMQAMMPAYEHHLTHQEVQEITRFYASPAGQKLLSEMPRIMAEYMVASRPTIQKWVQGELDELKASTEEYAKTLKQQEKTPATAPKAKPAS